MKCGDISYLKIADLPQKHLNHIILTVDKFLCLAPIPEKKSNLFLLNCIEKYMGYVWDMYGICMGETWYNSLIEGFMFKILKQVQNDKNRFQL